MAIIKGTSLADKLAGKGANDRLFGLAGNDTLLGLGGGDRIEGGGGTDVLNGGLGNDFMFGADGKDTLIGGGGNDRLSGGGGDDKIQGDAGGDTIRGEAGKDTVFGGTGTDFIDGGAGVDTLDGGAGNDSLTGGADKDSLKGGAGTDRLSGGAGSDLVDGGDGADTLNGGTGNDTISGGLGTDTAVFSGLRDDYDMAHSGADIIVTHARGSLADGIDTVSASVEYFQFADGTIARQSIGEGRYDVTAPVDNNAGANTILENSIVGSAVNITAFAQDLDPTNNTVTYTLTNSAGGLFQIDSVTGVVTTAAVIDADVIGSFPTVQITVQAASSDGSLHTENFSISIGDVDDNDVGAATDSNTAVNSVTENATAGTVVGVTALAVDLDKTNNTITYALTDNAGGKFQINASTGAVSVLGPINRETDGASASITVLATSSDGSSVSQAFAIAIADADEFNVTNPTDGNIAANAVNENAAVDTTVGITANAFDNDVTNSTVTYSLANNANGAFKINATTGIVSVAGPVDFESSGGSVNITVRATSADGSEATQIFAIGVSDVNEAPSATSVSANATQISFVASDPDAGNTLSIASPFNTMFPGAVSNGGVTTLTVAEQGAPTSGVLRVRDAAGLTGDVMGLSIGNNGSNTMSAALANGFNALYGFGSGDTLTGGSAGDTLVGGAGTDTLTGGGGADTFYIDSGTDTLTDLGNGGADILVVSAGATVNATTAAAWTAVATSSNSGSATVTANGFSIDVSAASGTGGWTITNASNNTSVSLTGSVNADTITAGNAADTLAGGDGDDTLTSGNGADTLTGGNGADTINGGAGGDTIYGGAGADIINLGVADDNMQDIVRFAATADYGDTISNFDVSGTPDLVRFTDALNLAFDDISNNDAFTWASGSGNKSTNVTANLATVEAMYIIGNKWEGVTNANLGVASAVATAFDNEFKISGSGDALLVINDTNSTSFAVWQYVEAGGAEIQAAELTLIGIFGGNGTVAKTSFVLG